MQQTFEINAGKLNAQLIEAHIAKFGSRNVRVTIEDVKPEVPDQKKLFKKMEKLRKKLSDVKVDPNLDLSMLANEMLDTPL